MKNVVITGSTRGIGFGLAREFLKKGCRVTISGRRQEDVDPAVERLTQFDPSPSILGVACDVTNMSQVENLWRKSVEAFGSVDIWLNNAGISHLQMPFWELPPDDYKNVITTNVIGLMNGCSVAMKGMLNQGHGAIYNMEGLGSTGMKVAGLSVYGTSKAAIHYFSDALQKEGKATPIVFGTLQPGMVLTDMLKGQNTGSQEQWEKTKKVYNVLANRELDVTPWLVEKILGNRRKRVSFNYVTPFQMISQLFSFIFLKRNLFQNEEFIK